MSSVGSLGDERGYKLMKVKVMNLSPFNGKIVPPAPSAGYLSKSCPWAIRIIEEGLAWWSSDKDSELPMQGAWV